MSSLGEDLGNSLPSRKSLPHGTPIWVKPGSLFFITLCCAPRGTNQLCNPAVSAAIFDTIKHRHNIGEWFARLVLLMPDHLHALVAFPAEREMEKVIRLWKGFLARQQGIRWQRDFFDHRLRSDESWEEKAHYIRMNPVRAGLVSAATAWPYIWEPVAS